MPAFIPFKELAEQLDIEAVAKQLGLMLKRTPKDLRAKCPACDSNDERALQIIPETNSFRCYAAELSGDCISLYAHLKGTGMYAAAKALQESRGSASAAPVTTPATAPQKPAPRKQPGAPFDPAAFAEKLEYSSEVETLGFTEEDAARFKIGFHRGRVYIPLRDTTGAIAGFIGYSSEGLKLPGKWLPPQDAKVVAFPKRTA